jgi:hypothetical protein
MPLIEAKFDINETAAQMADAIKGIVTDNWPEAKSVLSQFFERRKERLALLAELRIANDITEAQFESRLVDEKDVLEAELHAVAVITKAIAQKAANKALDILETAVKSAIKIVV